VTIETAGTLYLPVVCDLMSISPKLASSAPSAESHPHWRRRHNRQRYRPQVIERLIEEFEFQLKFVVDSQADLDEIETFLDGLAGIDPERVLLMPQGVDRAELDQRSEWLRPYAHDRGYVFCPRKQIEWFGAVRGT
jgi:7-carboxy-7-deazaguanine synthase